MRLVTISFNYPPRVKRPDYLHLLDVFEASVRHHMPSCEFRALRIDPPDQRGVKKFAFLSNTYKLKFWAEQMREARADGVNVALADCDMLCTGNVEPVYEKDFDVAYTVRNDGTNIPMNGGMVFAKPTDAAVAFFEAWAEADARMYRDHIENDGRQFHDKWRFKYKGMNQASFGYLCETREGIGGVHLLDLPTRIYNAVDKDWHRISSETVFLHIKSKLRKCVLNGELPFGTYRPAMLLWYEARARAGLVAK